MLLRRRQRVKVYCVLACPPRNRCSRLRELGVLDELVLLCNCVEPLLTRTVLPGCSTEVTVSPVHHFVRVPVLKASEATAMCESCFTLQSLRQVAFGAGNACLMVDKASQFRPMCNWHSVGAVHV